MLDPLISLDGEQYRLARKSVLEQAMLGPSARSWSCDRIPVASTRIARPNIRPSGERPNEYLLTLDDWSGGVCNLHDNSSPAAIHTAANINPFSQGMLTQVPSSRYIAYPDSMVSPPVAVLNHAAKIYIIGGKYIYSLEGDALAEDYEILAATGFAKSAIIYHDSMYVACGSGQVIVKCNSSGVFSATGNVYADYFAVVEDTLWRSYGNNVYALVAGGDPTDNADWGSAISIGSSDAAITALNSYGEKLAVSKEDGLYLGDSAAIFPNVLPQVSSDYDNGKITVVVGSRIFYHCANGDLLVYEPGYSEELGLKSRLSVTEKNESDTSLYYPIPGYEVTALCSEGEHVWVATEPSFQRQVNPDYVLFYEQSTATYTDFTAQAIDRIKDSRADDIIDLSDHIFNPNADIHYTHTSDALYIGSSDVFYGVFLDIVGGTELDSVLEYWNGSAWTSVANKYDKTKRSWYGSKSLERSGAILFTTSGWATCDVDSKTKYWVRFRPAADSTSVYDQLKINEVRVIKDPQYSILYRGRKRGTGDSGSKSIIWEPCYSFSSPAIHAIDLILHPQLIDRSNYPYSTMYYPTDAYGTLVGADIYGVYLAPITSATLEHGMHASSTGYLVTPKYDCGTPLISKLFTEITLKGRVLDATHTIQVYYRVDNDTAWTLAGTVDDAIESLSLSNVTGYTIQLMFKLNAVTGNFNEYTELNLVQVRFREQPVYKNKYNFLIELCEYQQNAYGGMLPAPDVQLTNLEAEQGSSKTLLDPLGRSKTVTVDSIREVEYLQENLEYPVLLVELVCTEV